MRVILALGTVLALASAASADEWVHGYCKLDGGCVDGYWRSSPNNTTDDNFSTKGNENPYTGQWGTREPKDPYDPLNQPYQPQPPIAPADPWADGKPQGG